MPVARWLAGTLLLMCLAAWAAGTCWAGEMRVATGPLGSGVTVRQPVRSVKELKEQNVVIQRLDYSCGSAAVSTIFTYYLNEPVSEADVISGILQTGDLKQIIQRKGFSLLELKRFAESRGATAAGYSMDLEALAALERPVIVPLKLTDRLHFVVWRGYREGRAFIADPAIGRRTLSAEEFDSLWDPKVGLIISKPLPDPEESDLALGPEDELFPDRMSLRHVLLRPGFPSAAVPGEF